MVTDSKRAICEVTASMLESAANLPDIVRDDQRERLDAVLVNIRKAKLLIDSMIEGAK